jgi:hypothetical protein
MLADLGMINKKVATTTTTEKSMDKSFNHPQTHFHKGTGLEEDSEHTSATEDMSTSSSAWALSDGNLKEFRPSLPTPKLSFKSYMEMIKQKHIKKLKLMQTIETLDEKLDDILKKCQATKTRLSILEKMEAVDSMLSESDDESSLSGFLSFSSDESDASSFFSENSLEDSSDGDGDERE